MPAYLRYAVTVFVLLNMLSFDCAGKDVVGSDEVDSFQLVVTAVGATKDTSVQSALLKAVCTARCGLFAAYPPAISRSGKNNLKAAELIEPIGEGQVVEGE